MTLYHAFQAELAPHRPLAQILCIKVRTKRAARSYPTRLMPCMCEYCVASQGVVFFAFWQSMLVELAEYMGWLHQDHWWVCGVEGDAHCSPHTSVCIGRWCPQVLHGRIGRRSSGEHPRPAQPSSWVVAPRLIKCGVASAAGWCGAHTEFAGVRGDGLAVRIRQQLRLHRRPLREASGCHPEVTHGVGALQLLTRGSTPGRTSPSFAVRSGQAPGASCGCPGWRRHRRRHRWRVLSGVCSTTWAPLAHARNRGTAGFAPTQPPTVTPGVVMAPRGTGQKWSTWHVPLTGRGSQAAYQARWSACPAQSSRRCDRGRG